MKPIDNSEDFDLSPPGKSDLYRHPNLKSPTKSFTDTKTFAKIGDLIIDSLSPRKSIRLKSDRRKISSSKNENYYHEKGDHETKTKHHSFTKNEIFGKEEDTDSPKDKRLESGSLSDRGFSDREEGNNNHNEENLYDKVGRPKKGSVSAVVITEETDMTKLPPSIEASPDDPKKKKKEFHLLVSPKKSEADITISDVSQPAQQPLSPTRTSHAKSHRLKIRKSLSMAVVKTKFKTRESNESNDHNAQDEGSPGKGRDPESSPGKGRDPESSPGKGRDPESSTPPAVIKQSHHSVEETEKKKRSDSLSLSHRNRSSIFKKD